MVFDPSVPFIYLPEADFIVVSAEFDRIFANFKNAAKESICDTIEGNCYIEETCVNIRKNLKFPEFGVNITLTDDDENKKDYAI